MPPHEVGAARARARGAAPAAAAERAGTELLTLFLPPTLCRNLCAIHAKRVTIQVKDIWLARRIRGLHDFGGWGT